MSERTSSTPDHPDFLPPETLEEADERKEALIGEIQTISAQLGDRDRRAADGNRVSPDDYWAWRRKAIAALHHKEAALRLIKRWIRSFHHAKSLLKVEETGLGGAEGLLKAAFDLFVSLRRENVSFREDEQGVIDAIEAFVAGVRVGGKPL